MFGLVKRKQFKTGDIIKYDNKYNIVKEIIDEGSCLEKIKIKCVLDENDKNVITVDHNNNKLEGINDKKVKEKLKTIIKFITKYNTNINFLYRRSKEYECLDQTHVDTILKILTECKIKIQNLYKIAIHLKKTQETTFELMNIILHPFNFITNETSLITFNNAENIMKIYNLNIDFKSIYTAWIYHTINNNNNSFYMEEWKFNKDCEKFCKEREKNNLNYKLYINSLILKKYINNKWYITTKHLLDKEKNMTDLMITLFIEHSDKKIDDTVLLNYEKMIHSYENQRSKQLTKENPFKFNKEQTNTIIHALTNKLSILTGPPGSGKTDLLQCVLYINEKLYKNEQLYKKSPTTGINPDNISLIAPTGQAFNNMSMNQKNDRYHPQMSGTCHKLIHSFIPKKNEFDNKPKTQQNDFMQKIKEELIDDPEKLRKKKNFYDCKFEWMIIDEASMVDLNIFHELLLICSKYKSKLMLIGDNRQLPSVGPGTVLSSLINSQLCDINKLTKIHRQENGALLESIKQMNNDEIITLTDFDNISLIHHISTEGSNNLMKFLELLIDKYDLKKDFTNTKFLCYHNDDKYQFTVDKLNKILQNNYNPNQKEIPTSNKYNKYIFRVNDRIIRTENDYSNDKMRANGERAIIRNYNGENITITYDDDKPEEITHDVLYEEFALNYATTIHKSQGSQFDTIVIFIEPKAQYITKEAFYTALSRAKKRCIIVTIAEDLIHCQRESMSGVSLFMNSENSSYDF